MELILSVLLFFSAEGFASGCDRAENPERCQAMSNAAGAATTGAAVVGASEFLRHENIINRIRADKLGVTIQSPIDPRAVTSRQRRSMSTALSDGANVIIEIERSPDELRQILRLRFSDQISSLQAIADDASNNIATINRRGDGALANQMRRYGNSYARAATEVRTQFHRLNFASDAELRQLAQREGVLYTRERISVGTGRPRLAAIDDELTRLASKGRKVTGFYRVTEDASRKIGRHMRKGALGLASALALGLFTAFELGTEVTGQVVDEVFVDSPEDIEAAASR